MASKGAGAILQAGGPAAPTRTKADKSPVTDADEAAQAVIMEGLERLLPGVPVVSEEADKPSLAGATTFLLVDPLDGTRDFLAGRTEYTVNIALIEDGTPVLGCIAAPALSEVWSGIVGAGAERFELRPGANQAESRARTPIHTRPLPVSGAAVAFSRSHLDRRTERLLEAMPQAARFPCGSSLKFCRLAEGAADLYPRLGPTSEWDIAAGHAVLAAAGGVVVRPDGSALLYGKRAPDFLVPDFLAAGDAAAIEQVLRLLRQ